MLDWTRLEDQFREMEKVRDEDRTQSFTSALAISIPRILGPEPFSSGGCVPLPTITLDATRR